MKSQYLCPTSSSPSLIHWEEDNDDDDDDQTSLLALDEKHHRDINETLGEVQEGAAGHRQGRLNFLRFSWWKPVHGSECKPVLWVMLLLKSWVVLCLFCFSERRKEKGMRRRLRSTTALWRSFWTCRRRRRSRSCRRYFPSLKLFHLQLR